MLENVFNLVTHDGGNTFNVMQDSLKNLGYTIIQLKNLNLKLLKIFSPLFCLT